MRALYDSKSKLDDRGIKKLLSEENKYRTWLKIEQALAYSQAEEGFIPKAAAEDIGSVAFADLDMEEMSRIKEKVGHGFVPFCKSACKGLQGRRKKICSLRCDYSEYSADLPTVYSKGSDRDL